MTNKTQNCDLEVMWFVAANFKFYRVDWPAAKICTEELLCNVFLRKIVCVDVGMVPSPPARPRAGGENNKTYNTPRPAAPAN